MQPIRHAGIALEKARKAFCKDALRTRGFRTDPFAHRELEDQPLSTTGDIGHGDPLLREYAENKLAKLPQAQQERLGEAMVAYWLAYAKAHPGYVGMDALDARRPG